LNSFSSRQKEVVFLSILLIASLLLFNLNLGNHYLWQDEAQTALIAKTVLQYGVPRGYDGINFLSQELGSEYGENYIWKWHTWFSFYLLAAFFKTFGSSTLVARLPFALFGIGSVFLLYFFARSLLDDKKTAATAAVVLLVSIPFLILSRQCRYYSLTAFFSLGGLYGYHLMTKGRSAGPYAYFASSTFLFHTHYVYLAALLGTVVLHTLLFHRNMWKNVLLVTAGIIVVNMPWIIWLSGMKYSEQYGRGTFNLSISLSRLLGFLDQIRQYIFPLYLFLIPVGIGLCNFFRKEKIQPWRKDFYWRGMTMVLSFVFLNLVVLSLVAPLPFFRYLAPVVPFLAVIVGLLLVWAVRVHLAIGIGIFAVIVFMSPFDQFLYELTHDFDGPAEGIVRYLNENADKDDTVAITYGDMPVKFYTGLRVVGGLTGEDLTPALNADWVILRLNVISEKDYRVREFLIQNLNKEYYKPIVLKYPDTPFQNRESPTEHMYKTNTLYPPIVLYQKVK
jgi:4-amino-4-deoxy-L-arabinose transferase-like glycosyltransferase